MQVRSFRPLLPREIPSPVQSLGESREKRLQQAIRSSPVVPVNRLPRKSIFYAPVGISLTVLFHCKVSQGNALIAA
jgi:hypothetical protein